MTAGGVARTPVPSRFLQDNARWLAAGFLLALGSSFGQTFFISIFSAPVRETIGLSHGAFGGLYMIATLASAATLLQAGRLADVWPPRGLVALIVGGLAIACLGMAAATTAWMLIGAIYLLRLFGQGMMSHLSQTLTARWFVASRGKALAISSLGYAAGEAAAPIGAVALMGLIDWRSVWMLAAAALVVLFAPTLLALLAKDRDPQHPDAATGHAPGAGVDGRHWTRAEVLAGRRFWLLVPGVMATGFIVTIVFFLPDVIAESKGWSLATVASAYPVFAASAVAASLASGVLVDRFGAIRVAPFSPAPMAAALVVLALTGSVGGFWLAMIGLGATTGAFGTINGALWAEYFGTAHLGGIKALGHAVMVVGSALGPGLAGLALDQGVGFADLALALAVYAALAGFSFRLARAAGP